MERPPTGVPQILSPLPRPAETRSPQGAQAGQHGASQPRPAPVKPRPTRRATPPPRPRCTNRRPRLRRTCEEEPAPRRLAPPRPAPSWPRRPSPLRRVTRGRGAEAVSRSSSPAPLSSGEPHGRGKTRGGGARQTLQSRTSGRPGRAALQGEAAAVAALGRPSRRAPCRCGAAAAPCPGISGDSRAGRGRRGGIRVSGRAEWGLSGRGRRYPRSCRPGLGPHSGSPQRSTGPHPGPRGHGIARAVGRGSRSRGAETSSPTKF